MRNFLFAILSVMTLGLTGCTPTFGGVLRNELCHAHWASASFPLSVVVYDGLRPEMQIAVQMAVMRWNTELGFTALSVDRVIDLSSSEWRYPREGVIYISQWDIADRGLFIIAGETVLTYVPRTCVIRTAFISVDVSVPREYMEIVVAHEIGHAFGLSHDNWRPSLMYPFYDTSGNRILDEDLYYVRWQYNDGTTNSTLSRPRVD